MVSGRNLCPALPALCRKCIPDCFVTSMKRTAPDDVLAGDVLLPRRAEPAATRAAAPNMEQANCISHDRLNAVTSEPRLPGVTKACGSSRRPRTRGDFFLA